MTSLVLPSPAKLNLFLHILGRRPDGYHELQTLFQFLDYGDTLTLTTRSDNRIVLEQSVPGVPDEENLVIRAARQLAATANNAIAGVSIAIDKKLPMGGGLGGGSSNAATTLLGLNHLWGLKRSWTSWQSLAWPWVPMCRSSYAGTLRGAKAWVNGLPTLIPGRLVCGYKTTVRYKH